jgi:hypothetical protein
MATKIEESCHPPPFVGNDRFFISSGILKIATKDSQTSYKIRIQTNKDSPLLGPDYLHQSFDEIFTNAE